MPEVLATVAVPTLTADVRLRECLQALERQSETRFEVLVIDNSGKGLVRQAGLSGPRLTVLENSSNAGFGAAVNQAVRQSRAPYVAVLNDDAAPHPGWLAALISAMEADKDVGMCACRVQLVGEDLLDSAGMLVARDGSSKQRGHMRPPVWFSGPEEVLLPSGSAAFYRRAMLEHTGLFDEDFFLYCEDTDLGLRARWAGWKCMYVPDAVVDHHYSHSAGRASRLKAYYVERNRLFVLVKNFPAGMLPAAPLVSLARYAWHGWYMLQGRGAAARFRLEGNSGWRMGWYIIRAHLALAAHLPVLLRKRRETRRSARVNPAVFRRLLRTNSLSARRVAEL